MLARPSEFPQRTGSPLRRMSDLVPRAASREPQATSRRVGIRFAPDLVRSAPPHDLARILTVSRSTRLPFRHRAFNLERDAAMWTWINCNLLGRHREIVTTDRVTIHLRCVRCGHRSSGWQLANRSPALPGRQAVAAARRSDGASPAFLTLDCAGAPRGQYRMPVPRITKEDLKARLESQDAATLPIILDVRLKYPYEHSTLLLPGAIRMMPDAVDPVEARARSGHRGLRLRSRRGHRHRRRRPAHPPGLQGVGAEGRNRRVGHAPTSPSKPSPRRSATPPPAKA